VFGGTATAESGITTADKFSADLIGIAKRKATIDEDTAIRPVNVDGHDTYCMVISPQQARDLRNDTKWIEAQKHANIRGEKNPIFSGAMGIYEGVVIHENNRVPVTASGSSGLAVGHALFLGAQAVTFAEGTAPVWREKKFDYDNMYGASIGRMFGVAKSAFKFDGTNLEDFGVVNVLTAAEDD
jgi:N4-gp56 family major capsid protein